jgi:L-rhamnose mutarotase
MDKGGIAETVSVKPKSSRVAFRMQLFEGCEAEYKRRHDGLWPELEQQLKSAGIREYSIFLEEHTGMLFGVMCVADLKCLDDLKLHPVMKKWWAYMKDIMETNEDDSPVSFSLQEVFYLP